MCCHRSRVMVVAVFAGLFSACSILGQSESGQSNRQVVFGSGDPTEHHLLLAPLVGNWNIDCRFRFEADGDWIQTEPSTATIEWIVGGRFLLQRVCGAVTSVTPGGYEGYGLIGYNASSKVYEHVWVDTQHTSIVRFKGHADHHALVLSSRVADPIDDEWRNAKWVFDIETSERFAIKMYLGDGDQEFLAGILTYTREPKRDTTISDVEQETQNRITAAGRHAVLTPAHEHLKRLAGQWDLSTRFRLGEAEEWSEPQPATASMATVAGGRFLMQRVTAPASDFMPMGYEGLGLLGYDTIAQRFDLVYVDRGDTGLQYFSGTFERERDAIVLRNVDAGTGLATMEWAYDFDGPDELSIEMHTLTPSGKRLHTASIEYTRKRH